MKTALPGIAITACVLLAVNAIAAEESKPSANEIKWSPCPAYSNMVLDVARASIGIWTPDGHHFTLASDTTFLISGGEMFHDILLSQEQMSGVVAFLKAQDKLSWQEITAASPYPKTHTVLNLCGYRVEPSGKAFFRIQCSLGTPETALGVLKELLPLLPASSRQVFQESLDRMKGVEPQEAKPSTEIKWSARTELLVPSAKGDVKAYTQTAPFTWKDVSGRDNGGEMQFVFVPTNNLVWCRLKDALHPTHFFLLGNNLVGVISSEGSILRFRQSTEKAVDAAKVFEPTTLQGYYQKCVEQWNTRYDDQREGDKYLDLERNIVGRGVMGRLDVAYIYRPANITGITVSPSNVVISMITAEVNKAVVLTLDYNLDPIAATVDGKQVFPKGDDGFVFTVGTTTSGEMIQQGEWVYDSPELKNEVCGVLPATVLEVVKEVDGKVQVKCKKGTLTIHVENVLERKDLLATDAPLGWMDKSKLVRVKRSDLERQR